MTRPETDDPSSTLAATAEVFRTPCGKGDLVWRRWGSGRPLILLHGGSGSWTHWVRNIAVFAVFAEVFAVDLPGLGDSAMPEPPLTPESCGHVLAEGIRRLIPANRKPHLVTFSFGGHVGTFAAIELGDHLASFTLSGCSALGLHPRLEEFPKEHSRMSPAQRRHVHRRVLEILMIADPSRVDDTAINLQQRNIAKARFRSREFALTDEIKRRLADVRVPLNAIWGSRDVLAQPSVEAVFDVLRQHHPELKTRVVPDAGHWSMYEQPDRFNAALLELLDLKPTED